MSARTRFVFRFPHVFSFLLYFSPALSDAAGTSEVSGVHTRGINVGVMRDEQALSVQFKMKGMQTTIAECRYLHKSVKLLC
jgi:hypothetical protein